MKILGIAGVVVAGLISPILTDIGTVIWLGIISPYVDATGNYWLFTVAPVVFDVMVLQCLVLWKAYKANLMRTAAIYLGVYAAMEVFWLNRIFNPSADIATYVLIILVVGAAVIAAFNHFFWRAK